MKITPRMTDDLPVQTQFQFGRRALFLVTALAVLGGLARLAPRALAQSGSAPLKMIVTAESLHGGTPPSVPQNDVLLFMNGRHIPVLAWRPLSAAHTRRQLYLVLDEELPNTIGIQFSELKRFIREQPADTAVGIAYMRNGGIQLAHPPSTDHAAVASSLRLPLKTGFAGSPYESISELIKRWPATRAPREMVMISSGVDELWLNGGTNPYTTRAIQNAQRAGIIIYSIYWAGVGHLSHTFWYTSWAMDYLSELSAQTGGDSFAFGPQSNPVSIQSYLRKVNQHLAHQYLLSFQPPVGTKSGYQPVQVHSELSNVDLVSATNVYVP